MPTRAATSTRAEVDLEHRALLLARQLPGRDAAGDHAGVGDDRLEPADRSSARATAAAIASASARRRRPGATRSPPRRWRPRRLELRLRCRARRAAADRRRRGRPRPRPAVGGERRDGRGADAARRAGDDRDAAHRAAPVRPARRARAQIRAPPHRASRRPPSPSLRRGRRGRRWARRRARPRPQLAAAAPQRLRVARARSAGRGPSAGAIASISEVSARPAWASPPQLGDHAARRDPRVAAARRRAASGGALPPWAETKSSPIEARGRRAAELDQDQLGRLAADRERPGEVRVLAAGAVRQPAARRRVLGARRQASAPARRRSRCRCASGRCGPCCSVAPSGTASTPLAPSRLGLRPASRRPSRRLIVTEPSGVKPAATSTSGAQVVDRAAAEAEQRLVDAGAEDLEHVGDAGLAVGRQPPEVGAADHHRAGPERQRLDDVAAAADAAVEQHLDLVADRVDDRRQRADRRRRAVEVVAAVVGDRDRVGADLDRAAGVVGVHHALDQKRAAPLLAQPGEVLPGRLRGHHPLAVGAEEGRRRLAPAAEVRGGRAPARRPSRRSPAASAAAAAPPAPAWPSLRRSSCSGIAGLPQSRRWAKVQSRVTMIPFAPAARARSSSCDIRSRAPSQ